MFDIGGALTGFMDWAGTPQGKAALMQFGNSMLNSGGQGFGASIGQALGKGAEAATRVDDRNIALEDRQRELDRDNRKLQLDETRVRNDTRNTDSLIEDRKRNPGGGLSLSALFSQDARTNAARREYILKALESYDDPTFLGKKLSEDELTDRFNRINGIGSATGGGQAAPTSGAAGGGSPASGSPPTTYKEGEVRYSPDGKRKATYRGGKWIVEPIR